jgi:hypothetical protein
MDVLPDALERLIERVEILEQRVRALESLENPSAAPIPPQPLAAPVVSSGEGLPLAYGGGVISVLGKAMLGIAGAYLLRAVAESSSLPRLAIAVIAIVYALLWLVAAVRVRAEEWFPSAIYAGTSALILAPMLWELTLSFKVLPAPATAAILGMFVLAATALAWKQERTPVFWVANFAAVATALVLSVATHQLEPFIAALLWMAFLGEYAAVKNHPWSVRPLVALASAAAIWALIFIYASPQSARMDYPELGVADLLWPACLLFLIYAASVTVRTVLHRQRIIVFETGQAIIAFMLAASSLLYFAPSIGAISLGAICLFLSVTCYAVALLLFGKAADSRNFHVFSAWAAGLFLAANMLSLPLRWSSMCLSLAALAAAILANRLSLRYHSLVFLLAAAVQSGLLAYALQALAGTPPARAAVSVYIVTACALACYAIGKRDTQDNWKPHLLHLAMAAMAVFVLAALLVQGMLSLVARGIAPEAPLVAFIRTLVLCALAFALTFAGSRWHRSELTRISYATLGLVAAKLLFEDLRLGHLEFIAAAIFLFAITLIAVPRLAHKRQKIQ